MGGTSTDIAVQDDGFPRLNNDGATVGNYRTRVKGIDIWTCGLGRDSVIRADLRRRFTIGPERAVPLAMASVKYPVMAEKVAQENDLNLYLPNTGEIPEWLTPKERQTLEFVMANAPCTLYEAMKGCPDIPVVEYVLDALRSRALVIRTGLTPTDLLHVTGKYVAGDAEASNAGVAHMAGRMFWTADELVPFLIDLVVTRVAEELIKKGLVGRRDLPEAKGSACCSAPRPGAATSGEYRSGQGRTGPSWGSGRPRRSSSSPSRRGWTAWSSSQRATRSATPSRRCAAW